MFAVIRYLIAASAVAALAACSTMGGPGGAQGSAQGQSKESKLAGRASSLLQRQMALPKQKRIPQELVSSAKCIAVFPQVVQAGFIIGGSHGTGLISCRQGTSGWAQAAPAAYSLTGGSVGLQAGAQQSSVILLFQSRDSMNSLLRSSLKLGTQIGVTTGPIGFNAHLAGAPSPVVAYVTSKSGLFAGVNLNGTKLSYNQKANSRIYTQGVQGPRSILLHTNRIPPSMQSFNQTLQTYVKPSS